MTTSQNSLSFRLRHLTDLQNETRFVRHFDTPNTPTSDELEITNQSGNWYNPIRMFGSKITLQNPDDGGGGTAFNAIEITAGAGNAGDGTIKFRTADSQAKVAERMRLTAVGLGIGTTTPTETLDVKGTFRAEGHQHYILSNTNISLMLNQLNNTKWAYLDQDAEGDLLFQNGAGQTKVVFNQDGKVGIGTTTPTETLEVKGTFRADGEQHYVLSNTNLSLMLNRLNNTKWTYLAQDTEGDFLFQNGAGQTNVVFNQDGKVGIGTTTPNFLLEVKGAAAKPGGGSWSDSSDARLKKNIQKIDGREALNKLMQLEGVTYEWIYPQEHVAGQHAGVLAQNLEKVFPDWVEEIEPNGEDKTLIPEGQKAKAISFPHDFNAYLIEAIKEQQRQINEQGALIAQLKDVVCLDHPNQDVCR